MKPEIVTKFLSHTDETGRFIVVSPRTGKRYFVEPIGDPHREWGSASTSAGDTKFAHKKGDGKYRGSIDKEDTLITEENGFVKIHNLEPGTSPHLAIETNLEVGAYSGAEQDDILEFTVRKLAEAEFYVVRVDDVDGEPKFLLTEA